MTGFNREQLQVKPFPINRTLLKKPLHRFQVQIFCTKNLHFINCENEGNCLIHSK